MTEEEREALLKRYPDAFERLDKVHNLLMSASSRVPPPDESSNNPPKPKATRSKRKLKSE